MAGLTSVGVIWLDVSRLLSRVGRGVLTGIDRVELAYLDHLLQAAAPETRYICRTTRGVLLLDHLGGACLADLVHGHRPLGRADTLSRLTGRGHRPRHRAEAALRACAVDRVLMARLPTLLARHGKCGLTYLNVGHANLSERVLASFSAQGARIVVLLHDIIPILHPDTVAPDMPVKFAGRIDRVRRHARLVICNSEVTAQDLRTHWAGAQGFPELMVAHLGIDQTPAPLVRKDPKSVVMLGTIEPRKNHALMLDAWDILARQYSEDQLPHLHIIGPRGWQVADLLRRLDHHPLKDRVIFDHGPVSEAERRRRIATARLMVFPSWVEGYGLPPLEALALGTLPLVSDLPVLRETMGDAATFLPPCDAYCWAETIMQHVGGIVSTPDTTNIVLPDWFSHFARVARALTPDTVEGP